MVKELVQERYRLSLQQHLDAGKTQAERNKLGQFATPTVLARDILQFGLGLLGGETPIRFLDPALGTGSFFSALIHAVSLDRVEIARGYELDTSYVESVRNIWRNMPLDVILGDFTQAKPPPREAGRFNLLICNPPYVRHHHILNEDKSRLQNTTEVACGVRITGLAGLYCYFIGLSHAWMQRGGIAGWLIPSEFMDVNYGKSVKKYLLNKVTLLRIHRFDPNEVQFEDALVSSAIVWLRNDPPPPDHEVEFTFGSSLLSPKLSRLVSTSTLRTEAKWTRFPVSGVRGSDTLWHLSDLFAIKRGIATGHNKFFILKEEQITKFNLPMEVFRPILPSPRYIPHNEIDADPNGFPIIHHQSFLLDCRMSEAEIRERYPCLWEYLERGKGEVSKRYLCRTRKTWYRQEERPPAPILCTYLGRDDVKNRRPFRFILNHSRAIAANVYLLLYPKPAINRVITEHPEALRKIWQSLNSLDIGSILGEGRVYGGGLHKLEPKELGNVDATTILDDIPELQNLNINRVQLQLHLS
jgi:adenine-specific DNA-methyltransferase